MWAGSWWSRRSLVQVQSLTSWTPLAIPPRVAAPDVPASGIPSSTSPVLRSPRLGTSLSAADQASRRDKAGACGHAVGRGADGERDRRAGFAAGLGDAHRGGQETTFDIRFTGPVRTSGPRPAATRSSSADRRHALLRHRQPQFRDRLWPGHRALQAGPRAPRPRFESNVASMRPVTSWCPGTYRGSVVEIVVKDLAPPVTLGAFEFHVRPTRSTQGRPSTGEILVDEQLPRDLRVKVRPRRGGPGGVFRVSFRARINGRLHLALEHRGSGCRQRRPTPCRSGAGERRC